MKHTKLFSAALLWALTALLLLAGATYAWFTFRNGANTTPLSGTVGRGDGDLLICATQDGTFAPTCELPLVNPDALLQPLTTADGEEFFVITAQSPDGIALSYRSAASQLDNKTLSGMVYLKADGSDFDVYLWKDMLYCGEEAQALAAMRLALQIEVPGEAAQSYLFALDDLGDVGGAAEKRTIPTAGQVVSAVNSGIPSYVDDPARSIDEFTAHTTEDTVERGEQMLCRLPMDTVTPVRFRLYLEGCDNNCINEVQGKDIALQLGFAGVQSDQ